MATNMAQCTQSVKLSKYWLIPGSLALLLIFSVIALAFFSLIRVGFLSADNTSVEFDHYLWHVIQFSFYQAFISSCVSVIPALFLACSFHRLHFKGKQLLLQLYTMTFVLPAMVVILGIIAIYGQRGWLATINHLIGSEYTLSLYGITGIVLAHLFYNLPFALRIFYQSLNSIDETQYKLALQLRFSVWQRFRWIELPVLIRQFSSVFALVFLICFSSFAIVLTLGGGPQSSTLEVAIYQALREFELKQTAILAIIQFAICSGLLILAQRISTPLPSISTKPQMNQLSVNSFTSKIIDTILIIISLFIILLPLLAIIAQGVQAITYHRIMSNTLWQATFTSILFSVSSAVLSLVLAFMLLWSSRQANTFQQPIWKNRLLFSGKIILAIPAIVLSSGFAFFIFYYQPSIYASYLFITITQALLALPFVIKVLEVPMEENQIRYIHLIQSLRIRGINRFYWLDYKALKKPILLAFAYGLLISFGDLAIVMLLANQEILTLPYLLYQQLAAYRMQDGALTACVLLLISFLLFIIIEYLSRLYDRS